MNENCSVGVGLHLESNLSPWFADDICCMQREQGAGGRKLRDMEV